VTDAIVSLYITLVPVIIGGVINSVFCASPILRSLEVPIDFGQTFIDRKRIFGDSKTFKGFLGYIVFIAITTIAWGMLCASSGYLTQHNFFYTAHENTVLFNLQLGIVLGLVWAVFELPNSFSKRRLNIGQSYALTGASRIFFVVFDQADSIFGIMLVLALYNPITFSRYLLFVAIGTCTHLFFNYLLFQAKLRKMPV
jgi:hypothetical protein